jgi:hypothetical protein
VGAAGSGINHDRRGRAECADGEHLSIADDPIQFATAVQALLDDPASGRAMGEAGRAYLRPYTWPAAWKKLGRHLDLFLLGGASWLAASASAGVPYGD